MLVLVENMNNNNDIIKRFKWLKVSTFFIIVFAFLFQNLLINSQPALAAANNRFKIDDQISVTASFLRIRSGASLNSKILGYQLKNAIGKIVDGPKFANGITWWKVNYEKGVDGWSSDTYLVKSLRTKLDNIPNSSAVIVPVVPVPVITPLPVLKPVPVVTTSPDVITPVTSAAKSIAWGAYAGEGANDLANLESLVGKKTNIHAIFIGWNDEFPSALAANLKSQGKTLLIFWEPYGTTISSLNAGNSDAYMTTFASAAKNSGASVILAPFHEMNGNWDSWDGYNSNNKQINTPASIISAWRHMHDIFSSATNIKFAWAVNNDSVPDIAANAIGVYYPGDAYVDYVGIDGFNFGNPWQSPAQVFDSAISKVAVYNKPIYIFSTAVVAHSQKAAWIKDFGSYLKSQSKIAGWVWFNQNGADGNWVINSDSASLAAFKIILQ